MFGVSLISSWFRRSQSWSNFTKCFRLFCYLLFPLNLWNLSSFRQHFSSYYSNNHPYLLKSWNISSICTSLTLFNSIQNTSASSTQKKNHTWQSFPFCFPYQVFASENLHWLRHLVPNTSIKAPITLKINRSNKLMLWLWHCTNAQWMQISFDIFQEV